MIRLLEKSWLVVSIAIILGLFLPGFSSYLQPYLTLILIALMTISTISINPKDFMNKKSVTGAIYLFLINYVFLTILILILTSIFIKDSNFKAGFVVMAAVPCAISVIPFTKLLKGDVNLSTFSLILSYFASLILTPSLIWFLFRESIQIIELVKTVFLLIILPLILSRLIKPFHKKFDKYDTLVTNLFFLVLIYGFIGPNSKNILENIFSLVPVLIVLFLRTFIPAAFFYYILKKKNKKFAISASIFASYKNLGYAALLSLTLFGPEATLPAILGIMFENINFIVLSKLVR